MALFRLLIIFVISIVLDLYMFCEGHEMCANGLPLVKKASLKFCSLGNQDYGCCTEEYESTIKEKFDDLIAKIPENLAEACSSNLKEMLCHICHPLSGHSFESVVKLELPGMCPNYCQEFFQKCETLIQYLGEKSKKTYLLSKNSKDFCKKMETKDISYCYPDVKSNSDVMPGMSLNGNENNMATSHVSLGPECVCFKQMQGESILPMKIQEFKDGSGRLLVAELAGILSIFHANGTKEKKPYFDIVDYINRKDYEDQHTSFGLPSFALHPNFNANGKLYVIYAKLIHGKLTHRVSEFIMTSDVQPEKTERILLELQPPYKWHNLDDLFFGDDGYLYIFNGDGGIQGDPDKLAQNGKSFFGKALRIDVDTRSGSKEYGIPPDNPFVNDDSLAPEVFAYGLRNPWRCSEDSGDRMTGKGKGRIFCVDVGYNKYEEINIVKKGGNYGWNGKEGFSCFDSKICNKMENEEFPIFAYNHMKGKSVIGGEVYRGNCIPHLQGKYLFADYYFKYLSTLKENDDIENSWVREDLTVCDECPSPLTKNLARRIYSFGRDDKGEVYIMATSKHGFIENTQGYIYKIVTPHMMENCERTTKQSIGKVESKPSLSSSITLKSDTNLNSGIVKNNENSVKESIETDDSTKGLATDGPTTDSEIEGILPEEVQAYTSTISSLNMESTTVPAEQDISTKTTSDADEVTEMTSSQNLLSKSVTSGHVSTTFNLANNEITTETPYKSVLFLSSTALTRDAADVNHLSQQDGRNDKGDTNENDNVRLVQEKFVIASLPEDKSDQHKINGDSNLDISKLGKSTSRNGSESKCDNNAVYVKYLVFVLIRYLLIL